MSRALAVLFRCGTTTGVGATHPSSAPGLSPSRSCPGARERAALPVRVVTAEVVLPRRVWMYWHQGWSAAPAVARRCADTWRSRNPDWDIELLDGASEVAADLLSPVVQQEAEAALPARADLLRLALLARHGGVWADATLWCARPLDDWIDSAARPSGFFAYDQPTADRPMDTWFLAAASGNYVARRWHDEAQRLLEETHRRAARRPASARGVRSKLRIARERIGTRCTVLRFRHGAGRAWGRPYGKLAIPTVPHPKLGVYFWVHYLFRKLLEEDEEFRRLWRATPKIRAAGPLRLLHAGMGSPASPAVLAAVRGPASHVFKTTYKVDLPGDLSGTVLGALFDTARE